jgi:hypothetical protein
MKNSYAHDVDVTAPARLRLRRDLQAIARRSGPTRRWSVKDPLLLAYFDLSDEQWSLLGLFDQWFDFRGRFTPRDDDDAAGASAGSNDLR